MGVALTPVRDRVARWAGLVAALAYALLYLYSVGNIVVAPGVDLVAGATVPSASIARDWSAKMWKPIAPFVWEPVAVVYPFRSVGVFLSVPNLLLALSLGALVGLNATVALARARLGRTAGGRRKTLGGLLASAPGLLTGLTCCAPTVVLALGSLAAGFTVAVLAVRPYFIPVAALALGLNLAWGLRQFGCSVAPVGRDASPPAGAPPAAATTRPNPRAGS
ncbi:MAG: hypothetical protein ACE5FK_10550 [Candidatus Methylomirabilia bacterium]